MDHNSPPLQGGRLSYLFLFAPNFAEMFRFYRDALGFEVLFAEEDSYAFLRLPGDTGPQLALYEEKGEEAQRQNLFLAIDVEDLEASIKELIQRGVAVEEIRDVPYGRAACFKDPAGNTVELHKPDEKPAKQAEEE